MIANWIMLAMIAGLIFLLIVQADANERLHQTNTKMDEALEQMRKLIGGKK